MTRKCEDILNENENDLMNWTSNEIKVWCDEGLIPEDLLHAANEFELIFFLIKNKEKLQKHYRHNTKTNRYQVLPYPSNDDKAYELHIIEMKSNKTFKILEKKIDFEIFGTIKIEIKAKEFADWIKEPLFKKKLSNEKIREVKEFISNNSSFSPQDLIDFIENSKKEKKTQKYRQSGHLVDEKLKYFKENQMSLFDLLTPETKRKIEESQLEVKAEGIKLTTAENKLIHALNLILHEKSDKNPKSENFYSGNVPSQIVEYGQNKHKAAVLKFKPCELYKAYMGKEEYSGADIAYINNILYQLESKRMLIKYDRIKKVKNGNKTETLIDRIEDFQSLIKIILFIPDLTEEERDLLDSGKNEIRENKGEFVIALNPIFTDQIDTKFIEFPLDTNRRLIIAAGGHNKVTSSMHTLMEWMLRDLSAKRYKTEMNNENLPHMLGLENCLKQGRKKRLQERIEKDVQAMINLGLVTQVEKKPNTTGGLKWVFHLNKDYE